MRALVVGAGGHGQVVADILLRMADAGAALTVAGYLDDNPGLEGVRLLGLPVLGRLADRASVPHEAVDLAVGNNLQRHRPHQALGYRSPREYRAQLATAVA